MRPFILERHFAIHEFTAPYLLCCSDCEALSLQSLLALADEDSLRLWQQLSLGYTESQGHPLLREEISRLYTDISAENVLLTVPEEGIFMAMHCLLEKGNHVIVTAPAYQSLYELAQSKGCKLTFWQPRREPLAPSGWVFDPDDLKALLQEDTQLLVLNFPHNPTGATLTEATLRQIIGWAQQRNIPIFSDEMYRYLEHDPALRLPSVADIYDKGLSLSGMSKSFSLPGLRVGWLSTRHEVLYRKLSQFKDYTTICGSAPSEILALMGLRAKDAILARNLQIIKQNLDLLDGFFAQHQDLFRWSRPQTTSIAFPEYLGPQSVSDYCHALLQAKGVMLLQAPLFEYAGPYFRIGFGRRNLPEALAQWKLIFNS